ncbi:MAG: tRNA (5-methylaminomethyl-2-thiouridine)(34)-methyltransferase MnmD [Prolixibacteraceae bacterium]|jgi:tRNA U34 5-methylaminomethyl-2-thiouridine-forming methyltransferase MnmC|nr:tRNA (5-methylaminomethyl-2-thiouridine)(34)-methyltransferase MnmD [Prolixibacteraceae bacterium]MBT6763327.1 tRNA (5-methylaminomethyl-2-thiouridine)(34)-methyltransferase MnmD [Prolixibacteraceae bacterium]MBT6999437.1 tRNA (5-methylaminomethyl-2-thiouridine)(34)-methyltransferase MnmD [Prolixibacteraceae bacterium]MBT7394784.1 tRNA (5-methylaminomethyl-2-thiouridine)(34)-methyltransferase MnmD [Prolixibacteraceae bacterium]
MIKRQIIKTADGSKTLYLPEMDEQYHSVNGAITESNYVFIEKGYLFHKSKTPTIFEVGFGTGLNCLLTAVLAEKNKRPTTFFTIEKFPLDEDLIQKLNYGKIISEEARVLFKEIHNSEWNKTIQISKHFSLFKLNSDLTQNGLEIIDNFDIVYFDAFGPDKQAEMWKPEIFRKIFRKCSPGCVFVTYSAKGEVRRQLAASGYKMERLPGPPGKIHMLRGIK